MKDLISVDAEQATLIERDLPQLPVGTGFVWTAGGAELRRIKFGENTTFDSSKTPKHGDRPPAPVTTSSALVDELRAALAPEPEGAGKPESPKAGKPESQKAGSPTDDAELEGARVRIAALEAQLEHVTDQLLEASRANAECADMISDSITRELDIAELLQRAIDQLHWPKDPEDRNIPRSAPATQDANAEASPAAGPCVPPTAGGVDVKLGAERRPLAVLAGFAPAGLTDAQWATIAGFKRTGGTWTTYRSRLRTAGLIEQIDGRWRATGTGVAASGGSVAEVPPPGPALVKFWAERITGAGKMLLHLGRLYPKALKRDALAAELNMAAGGGTFGTYLSRLRGNGLLEEKQGRIRLAPALMGDQL